MSPYDQDFFPLLLCTLEMIIESEPAMCYHENGGLYEYYDALLLFFPFQLHGFSLILQIQTEDRRQSLHCSIPPWR